MLMSPEFISHTADACPHITNTVLFWFLLSSDGALGSDFRLVDYRTDIFILLGFLQPRDPEVEIAIDFASTALVRLCLTPSQIEGLVIFSGKVMQLVVYAIKSLYICAFEAVGLYDHFAARLAASKTAKPRCREIVTHLAKVGGPCRIRQVEQIVSLIKEAMLTVHLNKASIFATL
jgi:hypothetical protein